MDFNRIICSQIRYIPFLLMMGLLTTIIAQETTAVSSGALQLNMAKSDSLPAQTPHAYTLELQADQFVFGQVNQITVDVVVTVQGPDGETLHTFDNPARGPEPFHFTTTENGKYNIEVKPFQKESGKYTIEVKRLEPLAKDPAKRVDQLMAVHTNMESPGAVIAVIEKGEVAFAKAYGLANLTYQLPFTLETLNNIGSTSKQFTCFAIVLLAREGKLTLDDDVRTHIPELKDFGKTVTLRHLMTHTSGYREFLNLVSMAGRRLDKGDYISRDELIAIVQRQPELQNDPGKEWNYNNTAFGLLAMVVERVSGETFPDWMRENVFKPLGMDNSFVRSHSMEVIPNSALGYVGNSEGGFDEGRDLSAAMGAGAIYTTIGDLAKWIKNFKTESLGGKDVFQEMTTRFVIEEGDTTAYALGLFVDKHNGLKRVHHGGADLAHRSMLAYYPEIDAAVITQSNSALFPRNLASEIAELFFEAHMTIEEEETVAVVDSTPFNPEEYEPENFDKFVGKYELEAAPGFILDFTREEDKFYSQATGQARLEIVPTSDSTFKLLVVEASLTFHQNKDGKVETLTLHQNGNHLAKRVQEAPWAPDVSELATYTGRFFSSELETFYELTVKDSNLVIQHRRMDDISLTPGKEDVFRAGYPVAELNFIRNDAGEITALEASNGRTRGVRFEKQLQ